MFEKPKFPASEMPRKTEQEQDFETWGGNRPDSHKETPFSDMMEEIKAPINDEEMSLRETDHGEDNPSIIEDEPAVKDDEEKKDIRRYPSRTWKRPMIFTVDKLAGSNSEDDEPVKEAFEGKPWSEWLLATKTGTNSLNSLNCWKEAQWQENEKILRAKHVLKCKCNEKGKSTSARPVRCAWTWRRRQQFWLLFRRCALHHIKASLLPCHSGKDIR